MKAKIRVSATAIVLDGRGRFLMVCEGQGQKAGKWNFPTGRVRLEEDVLAAAHRELLEETGLTAEMDGIVGIYRYRSPAGHHAVRVVYRGLYQGGQVRLPQSEILDAVWMSHDDLRKLPDKSIWIPRVIRTIATDLQTNASLPLTVVTSLYGKRDAAREGLFANG
ncbi:NUDIX hydrolase [Alicyclobacillus acidiphilus]|uniref:NUDIX hydrolase n=1 Tax=Alicyclobacillus acidiphilus TaxID=182455 RepID=UPI00082D8E32|nr:NUDIX hydrolase [Alicyclobacillus acidiphilus]